MERDDVEAVVNEINKSGEFSNHFSLKLLRWDDKSVVLPMPVTTIPQKSVDLYMTRPSDCDLVVVIFWARMGSPLVMDRRDYLSGTHYEYSEALEGYEQHGSPTIWLYRCMEEPSIKLTDPQRDAKIEQFDRVTQFFKQFQDEQGRYTGGVNAYATHEDFRPLFKGQLLTYLRHLRDNPQPPSPPVREPFTGVPYRGLNALDEADAPIFFGRDAEVLEVLSRVEQKRLVFVLGASGSGKSSLVAAGVLPKLRKRGWRIVRCVPGDDPYFNLAFAIVTQLPEAGVAPTDYLPRARELAATLADDPRHVNQQLSAMLPGEDVLLYVDQFEEVFTLADHNPRLKDAQTGRDDVRTFIQAIREDAARITTLVTMRADFYALALPQFEALQKETFGLRQPSVFALYDLITRPAELAGLQLEEGLARRIIEDVGMESGALALVAYLMESLYLGAMGRGETVLTLQAYDDLGGVQGAINTLADEAYEALPLPPEQRAAAMKHVFRELIALTEEEGQLIPTRRRAPLDRFADGSPQWQFIEAFVQARLLVSERDSVEVAHEALFHSWKRLAEWIEDVRGDLYLLREMGKAAAMWEANNRSRDFLWLGERGEQVQAMLKRLQPDLNETERAFARPEAEHLLDELADIDTLHPRRSEISTRLHQLNHTLPGAGVMPSPLAPLPELCITHILGWAGDEPCFNDVL